MLIEEKDALQKFCALIGANCKGAGCMQWRWAFDRVSTHEFDKPKREAEGFRAIEARSSQIGPMFTMVKPNGLGFCGVAERPVAEVADG